MSGSLLRILIESVRDKPLIRTVFFLSIIFSLPLSQAQRKTALPNRFPTPRFEHTGLSDGLPENTIRCILQDRFGFLWLGTQNGLP